MPILQRPPAGGGTITLPSGLPPVMQQATAVAGQTAWTLAPAPSVGLLVVELNGSSLLPTGSYTVVGNTITFATPLQDGDTLVARYW